MIGARPPLADAHKRLAAVAASLLADRVEKYPALVEAGKLTQADADTGIRIMRGVADLWRAYLAKEPEPERCPCCGGASYREQRDALAIADARLAKITAADPEDAAKAEYAAVVAALLWHAEIALGAELYLRANHAKAA